MALRCAAINLPFIYTYILYILNSDRLHYFPISGECIILFVHVFTAADKFTSCFLCLCASPTSSTLHLAYILCVLSVCVCVCSFPYRDATIESILSVYLPNYVFTWAAVEPIMSYALQLQVFRDDDKCRFLEKIVDTADTPQVICTYQHLINCMKSPVKKERKELTVSDSSQYIRKWSHNYLTISYSF